MSFSSSKETCTFHQNKITLVFLEVLQVLKYVYCQEQLNFSSHLSNANEAELKWTLSAGVGDVWEALERGEIYQNDYLHQGLVKDTIELSENCL